MRIGLLNPSFDGAIDKALDPTPTANALKDATFYQDVFFTLLYNRICIRATGTAVNAR